MPPLSLLIKPASSLCNLRCQYCFYHSLSQERSVASYGLMKEELLECLIRRAFSEAEDCITFAFQGGEPTLCGLPFYEQWVQMVECYQKKGVLVQYALQTNGQLIDASWAEFFAKHHFLIGLSLDGYKDLHDSMRTDAQGKGSYKKVMQAAAIFHACHVDYNILTVVSNRLARHADKIYRFYKQQGFRYLQFIPCLAPLGIDPADDPHALSSERYAEFLLRLFDLWTEDLMQGQMISIRLFDNWVRLLAGEQPEQCGLSGHCSCQFVIEADGSVYPCDFYVTDEWRLGSVQTHSFSEMKQSEKANRFIQMSEEVPVSCQSCRWYPLCRNGCRRDRGNGILQPGQPSFNRFCQAYQIFFEEAYPPLLHLARQWRFMQSGGYT